VGPAMEDWDQPPSLAWPNAPSPPHPPQAIRSSKERQVLLQLIQVQLSDLTCDLNDTSEINLSRLCVMGLDPSRREQFIGEHPNAACK